VLARTQTSFLPSKREGSSLGQGLARDRDGVHRGAVWSLAGFDVRVLRGRRRRAPRRETDTHAHNGMPGD